MAGFSGKLVFVGLVPERAVRAIAPTLAARPTTAGFLFALTTGSRPQVPRQAHQNRDTQSDMRAGCTPTMRHRPVARDCPRCEILALPALQPGGCLGAELVSLRLD